MTDMLAAVDLGSNSFRMVIARVVDGDLQFIDGLRDGVRLAGSLDEEKNLSEAGQKRALSSLRKFGQRLRDLPEDAVRAVGTNTLRQARNARPFLERAREALGHPIEVVSGREEARLIYLGVSHSLAGEGPRLVVDIGGGSTECVIGVGFEPKIMDSLYMGCVSFSQRFFPGGAIDGERMERAETAAARELSTIARAYRESGWDHAAGASGTIQAVAKILAENGWSDRGVTPAGLDRLRGAILEENDVEDLAIAGLSDDRARVIPGGVAILNAVFESFGIERMDISSGAMREGVLYDLLGRIRHEDARERTIARFVERYNVDLEHAERVERTALDGLDQVAAAWSLPDARSRLFLSWGARLHEIGLAVAHSGFHKHGEYLIAHAEMPGFSIQDQAILSVLVRGHRQKLERDIFEGALTPGIVEPVLRLCVILRIAALLNRGRSPRPLPAIGWSASAERLDLEFPPAWLEVHPMTRADLEAERETLQGVGLTLGFE